MLNRPTLFILGAGASKCYNYPTGRELQNTILNHFHMLYNKYNTNHGDKSIGYGPPEIANFSIQYNLARTEMIDYYLASIKEARMKDIGKLGIALSIIDSEINSAKKKPNEYAQNDWLSLIFHKMAVGINNESEAHRNFGHNSFFLTFNYDRTLEHYLSESLKFRFQMKDDIVKEVTNRIKIEHVFGRLPLLPLESGINENIYGMFPTLEFINQAKNAIKLLHERSKINKERIIEFINQAEVIVFLGFGFAEENIKILDLKNNLHQQVRIYGTSKGCSEYKIKSIIEKTFPKEIKGWSNEAINMIKPRLIDNGCRELIDEIMLEL